MSAEAKVREDAAGRLRRLLGDADKAECALQKLRSLSKTTEGEDLEAEAGIFKAMADPCRLAILNCLREGEFCVCEIMVALNKPQSSTSHHLAILKDAGLVKERKEGKWSHYRLSDGAVIEMMNQVKLLRER
ncbi:MAG: ArsR/SmtB family transcription factor [Candidatus Methanospirareceae archaeon]